MIVIPADPGQAKREPGESRDPSCNEFQSL